MSEAGRHARFHVLHTTRYVYSEPVARSLHHAVLALRETPRQRVAYSRVTVDPKPASLVTGPDYYGNNLTRFTVETPSDRLKVDAESEVAVCREPALPSPDEIAELSLGDLKQTLGEARKRDDVAALEFLYESQYVPRSEPLARYARPSFSSGSGFLGGVGALMHRIYREFTYDPTVTEVSTPVEQVLLRKEGVCQDFAHFMIACLRSLDVPARYVSGYLVPLPGVVGTQASHAWVSVYSPSLGWIDFDPTNDVRPSGGHITVGWGRDYGDVSPIRGVVLGGGEHTVHVQVSVEVIPESETDFRR